MKRYKQIILSNFFIAIDGSDHHLVEANLDIESRDDRTLCTEVLHGEYSYKVLTNELLPKLCPICTAILIRRINNMPQEAKPYSVKPSEESKVISSAQMKLFLPEAAKENGQNGVDFEQFELVM